MKLSEFDYILPKELIAQYPVKAREKCRLMVLDRANQTVSHKTFEDISGYFKKGDCLVLNDTKVIAARLFGKRKTGGRAELLLLEKKNPVCEALVRPSSRLKEGEKITLESGDEIEVLDRGEVGRRVKFNRSIDDILKESGHIPLPPYIDRIDEASDKDDYQTVYGVKEGATASPTAGLHFTRELIEKIQGQGASVQFVTLHTNYGTFAPIKTDEVEAHKMHKEYFELSALTAKVVNETKKNGGKIFAVGTSTSRVLEYCASLSLEEAFRPTVAEFTLSEAEGFARNDGGLKGYTDMFIYPGYQFKVVDHLITNFHLPKSTLLLLISAFAEKEFIFEAYRQAIRKRYRFFSYGDAMLIL